MLDVRRMQVLQAVVTSGSITTAARNLGYTPSAISQQLSTLEREAGVALLKRVGRGVQATPAGLLLTEHAARLGEQLNAAETELVALKDGRIGTLSIRYFATAGVALVPPAVARVRREHPGIEVDLKLVDPGDPLPEVEKGEADVAIIVLPRRRPPAKNVELVHILDDSYRVVLPKGHQLARKRVVDLADLAEEPWIGNEWPPGPCLDILLDACAAAGFRPHMAVDSEDYQTAQAFVATGLGLTLIPKLALGSRHPGVVVRRVRRAEPTRSVYAALRGGALERKVVRCLLAGLAGGAEDGWRAGFSDAS